MLTTEEQLFKEEPTRKVMRIAIFTDSFLPLYNGIVTVTLSLAEHLADRGHQVYIFAPRYNTSNEYKHKNITIKLVPSIQAFHYEELRLMPFPDLKIINYLKKERVEVIHFQTPVILGLEAVMAARILDLPLVGTYHTFFSDPQYLRQAGFSSKALQRASWAYARMYYNRCDLITCPTRIIRKELIKHGFKLPIKAISNGISIADFNNRRAPAWKRRLNPHGKLLLFTGRVAHEKNVFYLLDCFALVHERSPTTKLVIVGDGPQLPDVRAYIAVCGIEDAVIIFGYVPHARLLASGILGACDVFITASTTETQSITLLEAMANGLPSVGIKELGVAEVIKDRRTGFLVKNHDKKAFARAVLRLLEDDALRERMGKNALQGAKQHDMTVITSIWEKTYERLIRRA